MSSPAKLSSRSIGGFGENLQFCQGPKRRQRRRSRDVETPLDNSSSENWLFERKVDQLIGGSSCRVLDPLAVPLSEIGQSLGSTNGIDGLSCHRIQEH